MLERRYGLLHVGSPVLWSNATLILTVVVQGDPGPIGFSGPPGMKGQKVSSCFLFHIAPSGSIPQPERRKNRKYMSFAYYWYCQIYKVRSPSVQKFLSNTKQTNCGRHGMPLLVV